MADIGTATDIICKSCGLPPSFTCREHFVKERNELQAALQNAVRAKEIALAEVENVRQILIEYETEIATLRGALRK